MVERGKAGGRTQVWPPQTETWRRRKPGFVDHLARFAGSAAGHIKEWSLADVGPGRLVPWLPIVFGLGIIVYFAAEQEPAWWAGLCLGLATAAIVIALRARPVALIVLAITMVVAGFATATLRSLHVAHAVLPYPAFSVDISGFVEVREERERSDRIVIRVHRMEAQRLSVKLSACGSPCAREWHPRLAPLLR